MKKWTAWAFSSTRKDSRPKNCITPFIPDIKVCQAVGGAGGMALSGPKGPGAMPGGPPYMPPGCPYMPPPYMGRLYMPPPYIPPPYMLLPYMLLLPYIPLLP
jgi:hypothetical protein